MNRNEWRYEISECMLGYRLIAKHLNGDTLIIYGDTEEDVFVDFAMHVKELYDESMAFLRNVWPPAMQDQAALEQKYGLLN